MVLELGLVAMGLDQVELVLLKEDLDLEVWCLAVLEVMDLVALDQVDMGMALPGQDWVV